MIILLGSQKGGVGKSTLATNVAVELQRRGRDVLLIDADPQKTSSMWAARREAQEGAPPLPCHEGTGNNLSGVIRDSARRYEDLVIDTAGYDSAEFRLALLVCDVVVSPFTPSQADLETCDRVNALIMNARMMRKGADNDGPRAMTIMTRCPTHHWNEEVAMAREFFSNYPDLPLSANLISDRKVYRDAMLLGVGVTETNNRRASNEIKVLTDEIVA